MIDPGTGHPGDWTYRLAAPGEFTMDVSNGADGGLNYKLDAPGGILPGVRSLLAHSPKVTWDINPPPFASYRYESFYGDTDQLLGQRLTAFMKTPDGTTTQYLSYDYTRGVAATAPLSNVDSQAYATLTYDTGLSYVAMGEWSWPVLLDGNPTQATNFGQLLFVNGDRTKASDIPNQGMATYDARSMLLRSSNGELGIPFTLTADFGRNTIATQIDQDFKNYGPNDGDSSPVQGIHVSGSAPFDNDGSFNIPLGGTVNYSYQNQPTPPPAQSAVGDMNGAFFGPNAQEIGGTFSLQRTTDQLPLYQDAFVGERRP